MSQTSWLVRISRAIYSVALAWSLARRFGRDHQVPQTIAPQMTATFELLLADAVKRGRLAVVALLVREVIGLALHGSSRDETMARPAGSAFGRDVLSDLRFAVRACRRRPTITAAMVGTVALGIGANAAIFSIAKAVLLERLPFTDPSRVVMIWESAAWAGFPRDTPAPGSYRDWTTLPAFSGVGAINMADFNLTDGIPEKIGGALATANLFEVLGVTPMLGRTWRADEDLPGSHLAVINYDLWVRRFGSDPSIINRQVDFNGIPYTILGVMPRRFEFQNSNLEIWAPIGFTPAGLAERSNHFLFVAGRLRPGVTVEGANAQLSALATRLQQEFPKTNKGIEMYAVPIADDYVGDTRQSILLLLAAVSCVLLIACVNVANLLMVQAADRARELSVRAALGAGRPRLVRQLLTESVLLAVAGGLTGLALAYPALSLLERLVPLSMQHLTHVSLDPVVLVATAGLSLVTGLLFGLAPAWRASRVDVASATVRGGRGAVGGHAVLRMSLVVVEVALATTVLIGAGLLVRSLRSASAVDLGFRADHVLTLRTQLPRPGYADPTKRVRFVDDVLTRVQGLSGVVSAGYTSAAPLVWKGGTSEFAVEGRNVDPSLVYMAANRVVSPGYFETMGVTLRRGRFIDDRDRADSASVAVINETMAREFWPDGDALGRRFRMSAVNAPWRTVVGIVAATRVMGVEKRNMPEMYFPVEQSGDNWMWPRDLVVRTAGDPLALTQALSSAIWSVDRRQPVSNIQSMDAIVGHEMEDRETETLLLATFAFVALLLAAIGIYGVLASMVTERTAEIGLRIALGGDPRAIRARVVGRGLGVSAVGLGLGVLVASLATPLLEKLLFAVGPHDVGTYAVQLGVLAAVAVLAAWIPARRASRIDPMQALRTLDS